MTTLHNPFLLPLNIKNYYETRQRYLTAVKNNSLTPRKHLPSDTATFSSKPATANMAPKNWTLIAS